MMDYVSVLLKITYQQFRVNPHGVNHELAWVFEKIHLCAGGAGSATRAATRHQYKFNTFKYNLNITMNLPIKNKLLNLSH